MRGQGLGGSGAGRGITHCQRDASETPPQWGVFARVSQPRHRASVCPLARALLRFGQEFGLAGGRVQEERVGVLGEREGTFRRAGGISFESS